MKRIFQKIISNFVACFSRYNLLWQAVAIVSTYLIVTSGFDWAYFIWTRNIFVPGLFFPALVLGAILPISVPLALIFISDIEKDKKIENTALALAQAVIISIVVTSLYKAFTGRVQPDLLNAVVDSSRNFQFGFLRHGIYWGWPSSHTAIAFAMVMTVLNLNTKTKTLQYLLILYPLYVGIGVSMSIHWFSEFVSGAIIGMVIGTVVGKSFQQIEARTT